jgi:hypothetical protein
VQNSSDFLPSISPSGTGLVGIFHSYFTSASGLPSPVIESRRAFGCVWFMSSAAPVRLPTSVFVLRSFLVRACQPDPLWPAVHPGLRTRSPFSSALVLLIFGACLGGRRHQGAGFLRHLSCRCFGRRSSKRQSPAALSGFYRRRLVNRSSFSFLPGIGVQVGFGAAKIYFTAEFLQERARSFLF